MGNKDKTGKMFVACRDVFAELVNVLMYHGEKVLSERTILPGPTESIYTGSDEKLTDQFQDYSMYEVVWGEIHALYTLENQSYIDYQMVLRCAGYEGSAYRRQYGQKEWNSEKGSSGAQGIYPVYSMVLNWGERRWTAATTIHDLIDYPIHEEAKHYLNRNRIHVFDMRFLEEGVRSLFEGDMRIVLDYLSDRESLIRRRQKLRNPEEVMRMLHALTGDRRYLESIKFMQEGGETMCDLLDEMVSKGMRRGMRQGMIVTCKELGITFAETAARLKEKFALEDEEVQSDMMQYW